MRIIGMDENLNETKIEGCWSVMEKEQLLTNIQSLTKSVAQIERKLLRKMKSLNLSILDPQMFRMMNS